MGPILDHARAGGLLCIDRDDTGCCATCGVELSPCSCGGIGYHLRGCEESEDTILGRDLFAVYTGALLNDRHFRVSLDLLAYAAQRDELDYIDAHGETVPWRAGMEPWTSPAAPGST